MRPLVSSLVLLAVIVSLSAPGVGWGSTARAGLGTVHLVAYVESSAGLVPPTMEGGRSEVEMGDVNGDGFLDLVSIGDHGSPYVNTDEHGIMVWFGDGAGGWNVHMNGDFGYGGVALGDVNGDGLVDVGYGMHHNYSGVDFGDQLLEVALGDGSGQNWTPWDDGLAANGETWGMFSTDMADVDNDGDLDIASISFGCCAGVHVYRNNGDGTWTQTYGFVGGNSQMHLTSGDVNGDGNPDFAVAHQNGTVYLGDGNGGFTLGDGNLPAPGNSGLAGVALGDVNDDGRADLAFCTSAGGVQVWSWLAPGTWQDLSGSLPSSGPYEAAQLFDMDMDGHLDMAAFGESQLRIWAGDGAGGWTEAAAFNTPAPGYLVAFRVGGDADHNGYPDIAIAADEGSWPNDHNVLHFYRETSAPAALSVAPVFPRGHESFRAGGVVFVDWISAIPSGGPGTVDLAFSTHGPAGPWTAIAADLPNGGRYQWRVPPDTPSTNEAYIRYTLSVPPDVVTAVTPAAFNILGSFIEPIVGLAADNDSPTPLGAPTHLTATVVSGTNIVYTWALGDGATGSGATTAHTYAQMGAYTAVVTASNDLGTLTATTRVTITAAPIVGLAAWNDSPTALGAPTHLTATVAGGTDVAYAWAFGDGAVGSGATTAHTYPAAGRFTATVTATNAVSWQTAATVVRVEEPPAGLAAWNDSPTPLGAPTHLTATVAAGTNVSYTWALGDGTVGDGAAVAHTYPAVGLYAAVVTAANAAGRLTATTWVTVTDVPLDGLAAGNDGPTPLGAPTHLTATVAAGTNVSYTWALGDGTMGDGAAVAHTYPAVGLYAAVVTASNAAGRLTATTWVTVTDVPLDGLAAWNDGPTPLGAPTHLTATVAAGTNVSYTWALGDGTMGDGAAVAHTYPAVGLYAAVVTASNAAGRLTATTWVTVTDVPVAGLAAWNDGPTALGRPTTLTATLTAGTNVTYTWALGDSTFVLGPWSFSHTYALPGLYTATVTATNSVSSQTALTVVTIELPVSEWSIYLPLVVK